MAVKFVGYFIRRWFTPTARYAKEYAAALQDIHNKGGKMINEEVGFLGTALTGVYEPKDGDAEKKDDKGDTPKPGPDDNSPTNLSRGVYIVNIQSKPSVNALREHCAGWSMQQCQKALKDLHKLQSAHMKAHPDPSCDHAIELSRWIDAMEKHLQTFA